VSKEAFQMTAVPATRWLQLTIGVACMVTIANLQYGWTLFVHPINEKYGWGRPAIQVAFTVLVLAETWLIPFEGWFVDRFGPKRVVLFGGVFVGIGWVMNSFADSLPLLYVAAALGGIGAGAVFGTCIGNSVRWFPERRGLATGLTAAGYGMGSVFTLVPIQNMIHSSGYEAAFLWFGIGQGIVVCLLAFALRAPWPGAVPAAAPAVTAVARRERDYRPAEVLRAPVFWLLYVMFILVATGGLAATAQLASVARDFKVADVPVNILGLTLPALTFALAIDRVTNGITRPFTGWISDHLGRENTMFVAFTIEAAGIVALSVYGHDPLAFVLLGGLVFFAWGEIASLFPSICTDCFGTTYVTTNAGLLYTAKGMASLLVPVLSYIAVETGHWDTVFMITATMNAVAAVLAIAVLRPMRRRLAARATP
jgi:OFA family oxalate/formate antiporter-like MFS transporter